MAIISGGVGGAPITTVATTLTNAQVLNLVTTPVQLVAAPSSTQVVFPLFAWLYLKWTADYTNINAVAGLFIGWPGNTMSPLLQSNTTVGQLLAGGRDAAAATAITSNSADINVLTGAPSSEWAGQPLEVLMTNAASGNLTGGNAANALKVTVGYVVFAA